MKVMLIGSGGREDAILKKIKNHQKISKIYVLPGNGAMQDERVECVAISATKLDEICEFAKKAQIDFAIVAPDDPLVLGLVDRLESMGIECFGPRANAAILEGSKAFAKEFMQRHQIPTAKYAIFEDFQKANAFLQEIKMPCVIKASGLALGKGVFIAKTLLEAQKALQDLMQTKIFGKSGECVVIEEFLEGVEVSILAFCDGKTLIPMISSMDHKKILDNDEGENTGGMGAIAPNPYYTPQIAQECEEKIFLPTLRGLNQEGREFKGCLYFGLMLTSEGAKVIEYNCRFGDPETQVVLPLLQSDLFEIFLSVARGELAQQEVKFSDESACCVVVSSGGYPKEYEVGFEIDYPKQKEIYFAGVKRQGNSLVSSGGRVLGITCVAKDLKEAIRQTYEWVEKVKFKHCYYRRDIGKKALEALKD